MSGGLHAARARTPAAILAESACRIQRLCVVCESCSRHRQDYKSPTLPQRMDPIQIDDVIERLDDEDELFIEFLRRDSMSLEVYRLEAGATDPQDPHTEDEVYYIISGSAKIQIGDDTHSVDQGDVVFVEREVEHYFFDIEEDLVTLIFFAPPYGSLAED